MLFIYFTKLLFIIYSIYLFYEQLSFKYFTYCQLINSQ